MRLSVSLSASPVSQCASQCLIVSVSQYVSQLADRVPQTGRVAQSRVLVAGRVVGRIRFYKGVGN